MSDHTHDSILHAANCEECNPNLAAEHRYREEIYGKDWLLKKDEPLTEAGEQPHRELSFDNWADVTPILTEAGE